MPRRPQSLFFNGHEYVTLGVLHANLEPGQLKNWRAYIYIYMLNWRFLDLQLLVRGCVGVAQNL